MLFPFPLCRNMSSIWAFANLSSISKNSFYTYLNRTTKLTHRSLRTSFLCLLGIRYRKMSTLWVLAKTIFSAILIPIYLRVIFLASLSVSLSIKRSWTRMGPLTLRVMIRPLSFPPRIRTLTCTISPVTLVRPMTAITSAGVKSACLASLASLLVTVFLL